MTSKALMPCLLSLAALLPPPSLAAAKGLAPAKDQVVSIDNGAEPRELDPTKATGVAEHNIIENLFETLTTQDPLTAEPRPAAAASWTISKDGKTYTFRLRPDARWSDGSPVTAQDFVYAWRRLLTPSIGAEYAYLLYLLRGGRDYYEGKDKDPAHIGVRAADTATLVVDLAAPTPYFLGVTAMGSLAPLPRQVVERYHGDAAWTEVGHLVSNGPFKLAAWKLNESIKLERNEAYWDRQHVQLQAAYFLPIENRDTAEKAFMSGEVHLTDEVNNVKVPKYQREKRAEPGAYHPFHTEPYLGTYFYSLNVNAPGLNSKKVRQALALTIDRQIITERLLGAGQLPATGLVPSGLPGYPALTTLNTSVTPERIAAAKKLLAEAGYPDGKGLPTFSILYNTSENHKRLALAVQQMWKRYLGIDVKLINEEWKVFQNTQQSQAYQISRYAWTCDFTDPVSFLELFITKGGNNITGFSNKTYDQLLAKAAKTAAAGERLNLLRQAETLLMDELPIIPVYFYTKTRLVSEKLGLRLGDGRIVPWQGNIFSRIQLKNILMVD